MSKHVVNEHGKIEIRVIDPEKCKYMYDDSCCNTDCYMLGEFPSEQECSECEYFTKEDE